MSRLTVALFTLLVTAVPLVVTSAIGCERNTFDAGGFTPAHTETVCWIGNASLSVTGEVR